MKTRAINDISSAKLLSQNKLLQEKNALLHEEINRLKQQNKNLIEQFKLAQQKRFDRSSEKCKEQMSLFDEAEADTDTEAKEDEPEETQTITYERRKPKRVSLPKSLPREVVTVDVSDEEKLCDCGCEKKHIGDETTEKLDFVPASVKVIAYVRPKYACNRCDNGVSIADMPKLFLPKSIATPGLVAQTIISKFEDHLPLYRQEKIWQRNGIEIPRSTACDWLMKTYEYCIPLADALLKHIKQANYLQADETPVLVMDEPGRENTTKSYMWVYRRVDHDKPATYFEYQPGRSADFPKAVLDGFKGYLQTDCYKGYDFVDEFEEAIRIACMAHARRPFAELVKVAKKTGKSHQALAYIRELYSIEKEAKEKELSFDERYKLRLEKAVPILEKLKTWLDKTTLTAVPDSKLAKGINYMLNHWKKLIGYLKDGRLEIDNNGAENCIRPFAVGRKNWLFSGSPRGARASSFFYSLTATAKENGLMPYDYLRYLFENIIHAKTEQDYIDLLPFNCKEEIALSN